MKTIKTFALAILVALNLSCSNDDDSSSIEQVYYPTQISTVYAGSTSAILMHIEYDSNNRISQFDFVNGTQTNTYDTSYNSEGKIASIVHTKPDATTVEYAFAYNNGNVSQLTITNGTSSIPIAVAYNEFTNTYSVPTGSSDLIFKYDATGNIIDIDTGSGNIQFSYNSNSGVYKNISNSFPLTLVLSLGSSSANLFNGLMFSTQQLTGMTLFSNSINIETTRDENNLITTNRFINATTFEIQSTATVTYELR